MNYTVTYTHRGTTQQTTVNGFSEAHAQQVFENTFEFETVVSVTEAEENQIKPSRAAKPGGGSTQ